MTEWLQSKRQEITSIEEDVEKSEPSYTVGGNVMKLQYSGHLMRRTDSLGKTLMLGKIEGGRRRGR